MKMMRTMLALAICVSLSACAGLSSLMSAAAGPPPQTPAQVTNISRTAIDFAVNSFDAALYGLDFAMDVGRIVPGSDGARNIARIGRRVMGFLGGADAAQRAANSATYEEAFANANTALVEFRRALGMTVTPAAIWIQADRIGYGPDELPPLTDTQRRAILDRLDGGAPVV